LTTNVTPRAFPEQITTLKELLASTQLLEIAEIERMYEIIQMANVHPMHVHPDMKSLTKIWQEFQDASFRLNDGHCLSLGGLTDLFDRNYKAENLGLYESLQVVAPARQLLLLLERTDFSMGRSMLDMVMLEWRVRMLLNKFLAFRAAFAFDLRMPCSGGQLPADCSPLVVQILAAEKAGATLDAKPLRELQRSSIVDYNLSTFRCMLTLGQKLKDQGAIDCDPEALKQTATRLKFAFDLFPSVVHRNGCIDVDPHTQLMSQIQSSTDAWFDFGDDEADESRTPDECLANLWYLPTLAAIDLGSLLCRIARAMRQYRTIVPPNNIVEVTPVHGVVFSGAHSRKGMHALTRKCLVLSVAPPQPSPQYERPFGHPCCADRTPKFGASRGLANAVELQVAVILSCPGLPTVDSATALSFLLLPNNRLVWGVDAAAVSAKGYTRAQNVLGGQSSRPNTRILGIGTEHEKKPGDEFLSATIGTQHVIASSLTASGLDTTSNAEINVARQHPQRMVSDGANNAYVYEYATTEAWRAGPIKLSRGKSTHYQLYGISEHEKADVVRRAAEKQHFAFIRPHVSICQAARTTKIPQGNLSIHVSYFESLWHGEGKYQGPPGVFLLQNKKRVFFTHALHEEYKAKRKCCRKNNIPSGGGSAW
jgi:hypothetical protein